MPDTEENQQAYPQPGSQAPGLGFPVARIVVVLSLACGAVFGAALGRLRGKQTSENMLFHTLHAHLERDDVVLADRYYCSYWEITLLGQRGIDVVMRLHQRRQVDFHRGRRLGREDHVVTWPKPVRPAWMDAATYAVLPDTIEMRELRVQVTQPGFRTRVVLVATTLLDAQAYAKEELAALYRARWHAELDLRSLKQTMQMDVLRCKPPAMVHKEIWGHLLVYNLIRATMAQAALRHGVLPRQVSLQGARQTLAAFGSELAQASWPRSAACPLAPGRVSRPAACTRPAGRTASRPAWGRRPVARGDTGTPWASAPAAGRLGGTRGTDTVSGKGALNFLLSHFV
jgi:hypothetical protein